MSVEVNKHNFKSARTENQGDWVKNVTEIERKFQDMVRKGEAYVVTEKDETGRPTTHTIYRKSDKVLLGFVDSKRLEEWIRKIN